MSHDGVFQVLLPYQLLFLLEIIYCTRADWDYTKRVVHLWLLRGCEVFLIICQNVPTNATVCDWFFARKAVNVKSNDLCVVDQKISQVAPWFFPHRWHRKKGKIKHLQVMEKTIVTEWNLVCNDNFKRAHAHLFYAFGYLFGCLLGGFASDRYWNIFLC